MLRPAALEALRGCSTIVHAGDIGKSEVLDGLRRLAPLVAIRGNVDLKWAHELPDTAEFSAVGKRFHVLHDLNELPFDPDEAGFDVVISGHSHVPKIRQRAGVLYVNPGSAGPRRFKLPIAIARIEVSRKSLEARIIELPA